MSGYISPQAFLEYIPVNLGDTILFASDIGQLLENAINEGKNFDFNLFINLLQKKIGTTGNILFPTYNWDFCHGVAWNYHKTRSRTGILSQIALMRPDFIRTRHPLYSFAVWGNDAEKLFRMDDRNSFVGDTPFAFLHHKRNSKMLTLDVNLTHCFTFVHYIEEVNGVPYRFLKDFTGRYVDEDGQESTRTYSMYVRYLDRKVETDFTGLETALLEKMQMLVSTVNGVTVRTLRFKDAYDIVTEDIRHGNYQNIVHLD
ncbi:MAG: AAC(3) family N-acetyltransferase [Synergistaceae bacterium]|nr:AAC(3) family N-acetyltransferase [Synergistaceae bacterium]